MKEGLEQIKLKFDEETRKSYWWKQKDELFPTFLYNIKVKVFPMKCDNVLYFFILFICLHSYTSSTSTPSSETSTNTSSTSSVSSSTIVRFLESPSYVEVEEGEEAVLKCKVMSLSGHHTVRRFLKILDLKFDTSLYIQEYI